MNNEIIQLVLDKGYFLMFFVMIFEGPIMTILAAFFASMGLFSIPIVFLLSISGDVLGDLLFYNIGKHINLDFIKKNEKYFRITPTRIQKIDNLFANHGSKVIFWAKSTTGLGIVTFIMAGVMKMNIFNFLKFSILGGLVWSTFLIVVGYFFGYLYEEISVYLSWSKWLIIFLFLGFYFIWKFIRKRNNIKII